MRLGRDRQTWRSAVALTRLARGALALGLLIVVGLVVREGAHSIALLVARAGWRLLWLVPLHVGPLALDVMGWRVLILVSVRIRLLFVIAAIREAINRLLPVANVGGELVGIRLLRFQGVSGAAAASSVIVEMLLNLAAQYLFFGIGLALLLRITGRLESSQELLILLAAPVPLLGLFFWLLKSGALIRALKSIGARLRHLKPMEFSASVGLADLDVALRQLASAHWRLARGTLWQLAGLVAGCSETWVALGLLGHPVGWAEALVLESVALAARSLIFFVPAGLGAQEAGLVGMGHLLGLSSDAAIALSLAKRMREILFGLPALAVWRLMVHKYDK